MWDKYQSMNDVMAALPIGNEKGVEDAVPDVYGKVIRLYNALYESHRRGRNGVISEEVLLWRGLITLLALQDYLNFPLSWEKVSMPRAYHGKVGNLLDNALHHPPKEVKSVLTGSEACAWNGTDFYVLKWRSQKQEIDLLLYSPLTLVYPVADWRLIFTELEAIKWFDRDRRAFLQPKDKLNEVEKKIVSFWLERVSRELNAETANEVRQVIKEQIDRYIADLGVSLTGQNRELLDPSEIGGDGACPLELPRLLCETVRMTVAGLETVDGASPAANDLFSDQVCYFRSEENLFMNCRNRERYFIQQSQNMYAFLPVHPRLRQNDLSQSVNMSLLRTSEGSCIRVELEFDGEKYVRKYPLIEEYSSQPGLAVPYQHENLNDSSAPFISVWPSEINETWNEYYIMLEDSKCGAGCLRIDDAEHGSNRYVSMTRYMPKMIPILRCYDSEKKQVSVGMVAPVISSYVGEGTGIPAVVAVDFGTSSTRVFAKIEDRIEEISVMDDEPLALTKYGLQREFLMRDYFVPPHSVTENMNTLFSIYRKSEQPQLPKVRPILDGVIFLQSSQGMVEAVEESPKLMPNLKWNMRVSKEYYIAFMKQLLFHVVCLLKKRGVNSIRWKYALPESMDTDSRATVRGIWVDELGPYLRGITERVTHSIDDSLSESEAASRYFLFRNDNAVQAKKGFLVVDIGGGSTDIALWQGEGNRARMKWHASVAVAGRIMFTQWIAKNLTSLCDNLSKADDNNVKAQLFLIEHVGDESLKNSLIEMLLDANYRELIEEYRQECREFPNGWGMTLRMRINQALSLLMFALGCQVGALMHDGLFNIPEGMGAFCIAFGGRGSNILEWRGFDRDFLAKMFLEGAMVFGPKIESAIEIDVSRDVKCEVAKGLLIDRNPEGANLTERPNVRLDADMYFRITKAFQNAFQSMFQESQMGSALTMPPDINKNVLAAQIEGYEGDRSQIVKVLMEVIYNNLTKIEELSSTSSESPNTSGGRLNTQGRGPARRKRRTN